MVSPITRELSFPEPQIRMKTMDWKIIGSMLEDAGRPLIGVSEFVGLFVRTVERRLNEMLESCTVYFHGTPNFSKFAGLSCVSGGGNKRQVVFQHCSCDMLSSPALSLTAQYGCL